MHQHKWVHFSVVFWGIVKSNEKFKTDISLMTELLLQLCDKYQFHCIMNHCSLSHLKYIQLSMLCTQAAG